MQTVNYEELLYLANDGNELAYNELVETYIQNYKVFFYNRYAKKMDYADFSSVLHLAVCQGIASYDPYAGATLNTYLQVCVRNKLITQATKELKKVETVLLEDDVFEAVQSQNGYFTSAQTVSFAVEYTDFLETLTKEQKIVFEAKAAGKTLRTISTENDMTRCKVKKVEEKLKTKAKIYGLIEKPF